MNSFKKKAKEYLNFFCIDTGNRSVGSEGNRNATLFFEKELIRLGWKTEKVELNVMDWEDEGASLVICDKKFNVLVSPYSIGCDVKTEIVAISKIEDLEACNAKGKIIFLHGEIAREQIMPKNFVFYNPEEHQKIVASLERIEPAALVCATGRNASLAGGVYPFPLFEDGDFNIPSVYMTEEEGKKLLPLIGKEAFLISRSKRIPSNAYNIIGRKGKTTEKIVITAHIDAKKGTPGALDNATGVIVLLICAELLENYTGDTTVEIAAFNGEDYYAVPGQMNYIAANNGGFENVILNINIDGAGYKGEWKSDISFYNVPEKIETIIKSIINDSPGIKVGLQWPQGDHSIFVQYGRPAIAITSQWFSENMNDQDITHTGKDIPDLIDCSKLVEIAEAIEKIIYKI